MPALGKPVVSVALALAKERLQKSKGVKPKVTDKDINDLLVGTLVHKEDTDEEETPKPKSRAKAKPKA